MTIHEEKITKMVSLTDLWKATGQNKNQGPPQWLRLPGSKKFIETLEKRIMGKSHDLIKSRGRAGTYAHWQIALAYAEYLSPEPHMHVNEIYMRFRSNDITLADEIAEQSTKENRSWPAKRLMGKVKRDEFTKALDEHGVKGIGYAQCTNNTYRGLWGETAVRLKKEKSKGGVSVQNLRDEFDTDELVTVMFAEVVAKKAQLAG